MSDLVTSTLGELARLVESGKASCREIVQSFLDRGARLEDRIHVFLGRRGEEALQEAEAADEARRRGESRGPLHGLPMVLKANMVSRRFETNCASKILGGFIAPYDSSVVSRLEEAGLVILGTTNMDEFAMGSSCENSAYGPTANPWDLERVPGGSSGGSAAAVAARVSPVALGSDTGGSIRQPAALCGVTGLKPTYGRVSRYGLVAFASSLDQIGPIGRSAEDIALLLGVIAGHDPRDSTSVPAPVPDYCSVLGDSIEGLRVGILRQAIENEGTDPEVREALEQAVAVLERLGAKTLDFSLEHRDYGIGAYYLICTAEASSNLSRYDGVKYGFRAAADDLEQMYKRTRSQGFGTEVKRRILLGTFVLSSGYYDAYYRKAQQVRTLIRQDYQRACESCDLLLMPTTPGPAWPIGERLDDPVKMYLADIFTVGVNLAGLPAISIPCGQSREQLPIGLQLVGKPLDEATLLRATAAYQRETSWHEAAPEL